MKETFSIRAVLTTDLSDNPTEILYVEQEGGVLRFLQSNEEIPYKEMEAKYVFKEIISITENQKDVIISDFFAYPTKREDSFMLYFQGEEYDMSCRIFISGSDRTDLEEFYMKLFHYSEPTMPMMKIYHP